LIAFLLAAWSLIFTAPVANSNLGQPCPIGCRDTSTAGACTDLASFYVLRHRQSPTWVAKSDSMRADPVVWSRYWPAVVTEAAYVGYGVFPSSPAAAGTTVTLAIADTTHGWWYVVAPRDASGNQACIGNEVWK
jgi:hypothetical protein